MQHQLDGRLTSAAFVSDVHLRASDRATSDRFFDFLGAVGARGPDALFILGDLFEYWAGDDDLPDSFNRAVVAELAALPRSGIALYFMAGNRDFLIGPEFARAARLQILADPTRIAVGEGVALLAHGDAFCTDDVAYQAFRRQVREPEWQAEFLARPLAERHALIGSMRSASESAKREKAADIMDVNVEAVAETLRSSHVGLLIHGHTHRPAHHRLQVDGQAAERWVLSDWDAQASPPRGAGLVWDERGIAPFAPTG